MNKKERHRKIKTVCLDIVAITAIALVLLLMARPRGQTNQQEGTADGGQAVTMTTESPAEPETTAPVPDETEVEMLACAIYCEAGGNACSDLCRYYAGDVILNRVDDPRYPDTLEGVLAEKGQYGRFYWTGIVWPERAQYAVEAAAVERAYQTARALLSGEHSELYGEGYIWQAEFKQGTDVIYLDGIYFGR